MNERVGAGEQLTLGVIGHVDHGKTALVRALTGIETDRLKEEQERGLSIVLGFSYLESSRRTIDLIDVPGHEDFVRTMISGATGIDGVLLIVAANEGVMPQTREHFDIAELLGVDRGLIVLTKTDLVSTEELALSEDDVRSFVAGSFLDGAPLVCVSALRGEGLVALKHALTGIPARERAASEEGFYLQVDRVFGMRGFGAVVTGTLRAGTLEANHAVEILPGGETATIRGLQIHNQSVDMAYPGQRVAVNLRHQKREVLGRGAVLAPPGFLKPSRRIDVEMRLLERASEPLKNGASVRVLFGTSEAIAKVRLLDVRTLEPGANGLVQLRFRREVAGHPGERFIVRGLTPVVTTGGGRMLDIGAPRHRRFDAAVIRRLQSAAERDPAAMVRTSLADAGLKGADREALRLRLGLSPPEMDAAVQSSSAIEVREGRLLDATAHRRLVESVLAVVERYHQDHPRNQGLPMASIPSLLQADIDEAALQHAVDEVEARGELKNDASILSRADFDPLASLSAEERQLAAKAEEIFRSCGLMPPPPESVLRGERLRAGVLRLLTDTGVLVRLKTYDRSRYLMMHREVLRDVRQRLRDRFPYPAEFTVADVRDLLGTTRKYIVPLMEHLDASGVTIRTGNIRRLRER